MCGIFGILLGQGSTLPIHTVHDSLTALFRLSESRGKEAAGLALRGNHSLYVYKEPLDAKELIKSSTYREIVHSYLKEEGYSPPLAEPFTLIGHSRLVTNGISELNTNNQPVMKSGGVAVHNGIIVNTDSLYGMYPQLNRQFDVDTEVFLDLLQMYRHQTGSIIEASRETYGSIQGAASVAVLFEDTSDVLLASNTGSLFVAVNNTEKVAIFASEKYILTQLFQRKSLHDLFPPASISQIKAGTGFLINLAEFQLNPYSLNGATPRLEKVEKNHHTVTVKELTAVHPPRIPTELPPVLTPESKRSMLTTWENLYNGTIALKRCTRCVLPETVPYISFDDEGICNYCRNFEIRNNQLKGEEALKTFVSPFRSSSGEPDCIVGFSGGRDSTYGIHYIKNVLGMTPIAFTYDWGMVNDLARRNQSRVLAKLGVEHILVSADIRWKRENIRKNLNAWLNSPDLGMIPLLMAGDKQFYYYFHKIREQTGVKLFIFCGGHEIEETPFKYGFCNVDHGVDNLMNCLTGISPTHKIKLISYFAKQYLKNPGYINRSLFDNLFAYYSTYLLPDDYLYLYHFIEWDEKTIIDTIREEYDWEMAPDTNATWRIDDGTAPFYNYIYLTMAGFTEFDNFRSFQIREGKLTRDKAMEMIKEENKPRFEAIDWYGQTIRLDMNRAVRVINQARKLYSPDNLAQIHALKG
ncbi:MAG: hypothetical protein WC382_03185 [Methanoregulaceae archaeon]|jgi:hypothetical protein